MASLTTPPARAVRVAEEEDRQNACGDRGGYGQDAEDRGERFRGETLRDSGHDRRDQNDQAQCFRKEEPTAARSSPLSKQEKLIGRRGDRGRPSQLWWRFEIRHAAARLRIGEVRRMCREEFPRTVAGARQLTGRNACSAVAIGRTRTSRASAARNDGAGAKMERLFETAASFRFVASSP